MGPRHRHHGKGHHADEAGGAPIRFQKDERHDRGGDHTRPEKARAEPAHIGLPPRRQVGEEDHQRELRDFRGLAESEPAVGAVARDADPRHKDCGEQDHRPHQ